MYKVYDIVTSKRAIESVPKGTKGVILLINESVELNISYEVEFVDETGKFIGVFTVMENEIEAFV